MITGTVGLIALVFEVLCCLYFVCITIKEAYNIYKKRLTYFAEIWNWIQLLQIIMFILAVGVYVGRSMWTVSTIEHLMNNRGKSPFCSVMAMPGIFNILY